MRHIRSREETWTVSLIKFGERTRKKKDRNRFETAFLQVVHNLEEYARGSPDLAVLNSVQEARFALEKLVQKMDNLEAGFDRIAERSRASLVIHLPIIFSYRYS